MWGGVLQLHPSSAFWEETKPERASELIEGRALHVVVNIDMRSSESVQRALQPLCSTAGPIVTSCISH